MKQQHTLQPKLRFPEFEGDWKRFNFNDLLKIIDGDRGKNYPNGTDFSDKDYCLFLNAKNVTKNGFNFNETVFISKDKDAQLSKGKLNRFDLVLTTRGTVGNFAYYNDCIEYNNIRINSGMVIIRNNSNKVIQNFVYKYSDSPNFKKVLNTIAFGSAQPQLTVNEIKKFKINIPSLPEQQKIADYLATIDSKVNLLEEKKAQLALYKKAMMQKLFSQEIRFKPTQCHTELVEVGIDEVEAVEAYPEWEEKRLGEVTEIKTGISNRQDSDLNSEYTFFDRSQEIRKSSRYLFDCEAIIVAGEGSEFIPKYFIGKFDLHQRTYAIMNYINALGLYLFHYINFNRKYFESQAVGSTVKSLRLPMFEKMSINLPSLPEQQKIADFLSVLDENIEKVTEQISQTQSFKKAMLQQMFV